MAMTQRETVERQAFKVGGATMIASTIILFIVTIFFATQVETNNGTAQWIPLVIAVLFLSISIAGYIVVQPNQARVLVFFGRYIGSVTEDGWWWVNPFTANSRAVISLRIRNFDTAKIKVNDHSGNPVEIAAVVAWKVVDPARATFDVENYGQFVAFQSETAVRHVASQYPYDNYEEGGLSLTGNVDEVCSTLKEELQERLAHAGVTVVETRLSHLSYAPEIAGAMLRRQQASAIVAARSRIVEGAVGMVDMALQQIAERGIVDLDDERKAAMVSNLLVVLTGEQGAQPVLNAGSLYQ